MTSRPIVSDVHDVLGGVPGPVVPPPANAWRSASEPLNLSMSTLPEMPLTDPDDVHCQIVHVDHLLEIDDGHVPPV